MNYYILCNTHMQWVTTLHKHHGRYMISSFIRSLIKGGVENNSNNNNKFLGHKGGWKEPKEPHAPHIPLCWLPLNATSTRSSWAHKCPFLLSSKIAPSWACRQPPLELTNWLVLLVIDGSLVHQLLPPFEFVVPPTSPTNHGDKT